MMIDFHPWHLDLMKLTPDARTAVDRLDAAKTLERLAAGQLAGTIVTPGPTTILGVMGAMPESRDECEVFVVATEDQKRFPIEFTKTIRRALSGLRHDFSRIRTVGEDTAFYRRWFKWLGFAYVGPVVREEFEGRRMIQWSMAGVS